jgi:hypothetical protein
LGKDVDADAVPVPGTVQVVAPDADGVSQTVMAVVTEMEQDLGWASATADAPGNLRKLPQTAVFLETTETDWVRAKETETVRAMHPMKEAARTEYHVLDVPDVQEIHFVLHRCSPSFVIGRFQPERVAVVNFV